MVLNELLHRKYTFNLYTFMQIKMFNAILKIDDRYWFQIKRIK